MSPQPLIIWDDGAGRAELPADRPLRIGRKPDNDVVLDSNHVSRYHAEIARKGEQILIQDRGSSFGTKVNGDRITEIKLEDGDCIDVAGQALMLVLPRNGNADAQQAHAETIALPAPVPEHAEPRKDPAPTQLEIDESGIPVDPEFRRFAALYSSEVMALKSEIQEAVLDKLHLGSLSNREVENLKKTGKIREALDEVLLTINHRLPKDLDDQTFAEAMYSELVGYGPIDILLRARGVNDIMINGAKKDIYIERDGKMYNSRAKFRNEEQLQIVVQRVLEPLGRSVNISSPMVDARLEIKDKPDAERLEFNDSPDDEPGIPVRVNAIIRPVSLGGACVTVRKFNTDLLSMANLVEKQGSLTQGMGAFLQEAVRQRQNIIVAGGTGTGKTTLLNVLSRSIPPSERPITIEDSAELILRHANMARLEARPPNVEGKGEVTIRDLMKNALRMRPNRIIVGECRGGEALDMLQAMNTGHEGSMSTIHANSVRDTLDRMETLVLMSGIELPAERVRKIISSSINLIVQLERMEDGTRKVTEVAEITGMEGDNITILPLFEYRREGYELDGGVKGYFAPRGHRPMFVERLQKQGKLNLDLGVFIPKEER